MGANLQCLTLLTKQHAHLNTGQHNTIVYIKYYCLFSVLSIPPNKKYMCIHTDANIYEPQSVKESFLNILQCQYPNSYSNRLLFSSQ